MLARYERLVSAGELQADPDQRRAAQRLDQLQKELEADTRAGCWRSCSSRRRRGPVYMWGGVGRGKSMLMDLFVETLGIAEKRRAHFHEFMLEVDRRMRERRKAIPASHRRSRDIAANAATSPSTRWL